MLYFRLYVRLKSELGMTDIYQHFKLDRSCVAAFTWRGKGRQENFYAQIHYHASEHDRLNLPHLIDQSQISKEDVCKMFCNRESLIEVFRKYLGEIVNIRDCGPVINDLLGGFSTHSVVKGLRLTELSDGKSGEPHILISDNEHRFRYFNLTSGLYLISPDLDLNPKEWVVARSLPPFIELTQVVDASCRPAIKDIDQLVFNTSPSEAQQILTQYYGDNAVLQNEESQQMSYPDVKESHTIVLHILRDNLIHWVRSVNGGEYNNGTLVWSDALAGSVAILDTTFQLLIKQYAEAMIAVDGKVTIYHPNHPWLGHALLDVMHKGELQ